MADSLRPVVKMLIHRLEITRGYLLPGYSEADQDAQAAIAFAEAALAAEPPAPADPSDFQTLQGIALDMVESLRPIVLPEILGVLRRAIKQPPAPAPAIPIDLDALLSPEGAYEPGTGQEDGAQLVDQLEWWAPLHGCETLENLLDRIRRRILPHLRPPIAGIDVPGPDGDYGGLQELCEAEGVDVRIGAPLLKRAREAWGAAQPPAPAPAADGAARLRQCPTHGQQPANAWACPECLRELREELVRLKAPAADGERAAALLRQPAPAPVPVSEPVAWLWKYVGPDPHLQRRPPVARSLYEMDPFDPPYPETWRPLAPLYDFPQPPQGGEVEP